MSHGLVGEQRHRAGIGSVALPALGTDLADQPLRQHPLERGGREIGLDFQVHEAGHRTRRVVGVQGGEHEMPSERRLYGDRGRLAVTHLADHQDIRVLPQDAPQRPRERHTGLHVHRHLRDALQMVFDRVFDGDDFLRGTMAQRERSIERSRLAAAGGAGREQDPVRLLSKAPERVKRLRRHAQLVESHRSPAAVEQPQHHRLAVERRHRRHAQVQLALLEPHPDAPILRRPPLGDVQLCEQLDPRNDGRLESLGGAGQLAQHAVHTEAGDQPRACGLEVDVGRAGLVRLADQQVDEPDHGRLVGQVAGVRELVVAAIGTGLKLGVQILDQLDHRLGRGEGAADRIEQLVLRHRHQLDGHAEGRLEVLDHLASGVARDGHSHAVLLHVQRQDAPVLEVGGLEGFVERQLGDEGVRHAAVASTRRATPGCSTVARCAYDARSCSLVSRGVTRFGEPVAQLASANCATI